MDMDNYSSTSTASDLIRDFINNNDTSTGSTETGSTEIGSMETTIHAHGELLSYISDRIKRNNDKIKKLENENKPEKDYFKLASWNFKISNIIFLILPLIQVFITIWAIQHFNIIENGYLLGIKILLGVIGLGTIAEMLFVPVQIRKINDRLDDLEEKIYP